MKQSTRWTLAYGIFVLFQIHGLDLIFPHADPPFFILRILSLIHWIFILLVTVSLGLLFLDRVGRIWERYSILDLTLGGSLGLGLLAWMISLLGFLQILTPTSIHTSMLIMISVVGPGISSLIDNLRRSALNAFRQLHQAKPISKALLLLALILFVITLINTLTPPWDYDGLMYHLLGPQQFLDAGGITVNLANWYVNGPFSIEMLFTLGLSIGDDVLPKLIHFSFWILLGLCTYSWGKRWFSDNIGEGSAAIYLGIPALPIWASFAYIDLAWSAFEFLAIACLIAWWKEEHNLWLILSGTFAGMAMGAKYLGLMGTVILGIFFLFILVSRKRNFGLRSLLMLAAPAVIIASPWYLKNLLWLNNPVYPLIFGGPGWDQSRLELYNAYLGSFGMGKSLIDLILLPWNVYARHSNFGAVMNRNDIPNILFILGFAAPILRKNKLLKLLGVLCLVRIGAWFIGSQQLRFLVPIYPVLAILSASVIEDLSKKLSWRRSFQLFLPLLAVALVFIPIFYQVQIMRQYHSVAVLLTNETRGEFLMRAVGDYGSSVFIRDDLPESARVLMLGNGRGYYCFPKCLPDPDHFYWASNLASLPEDALVSSWLSEMGITHFLTSIEDLDFLLQHDQTGLMMDVVEQIINIESDPCLERVYKDRWTEIFEVVCDA